MLYIRQQLNTEDCLTFGTALRNEVRLGMQPPGPPPYSTVRLIDRPAVAAHRTFVCTINSRVFANRRPVRREDKQDVALLMDCEAWIEPKFTADGPRNRVQIAHDDVTFNLMYTVCINSEIAESRPTVRLVMRPMASCQVSLYLSQLHCSPPG